MRPYNKLSGSALLLILSTVLMSATSQSDIDIESALNKIFSPVESSMQTHALRRDIIRRLYDALQTEELDKDLNDYKRSLNSLARWGNLPGKRNLAALARAGYIKTIPDDDLDDKRSIASLAKNGQLPILQNDEEKRGIEALARNGELHRKREIQELLEELYDKRNIGSLARSYNFPSYGKRYIGSLARGGGVSRLIDYKRNIASLAREGSKFTGKRDIPDKSESTNFNEEEKRNLASIKAAGFKPYKRSTDEQSSKGRTKREVDDYESDEFASPVYQNQNIYDYEEMMKALTGEYPDTEKRFLGSVARSGWFRQPSTSSYESRIDKRHIGSLARLGWLPSLRTIRRFNRSGRSISECDREIAADGKAEDYPFSKNQISIGGRRTFLQPNIWGKLLNQN